jgi:hypothetical protein
LLGSFLCDAAGFAIMPSMNITKFLVHIHSRRANRESDIDPHIAHHIIL